MADFAALVTALAAVVSALIWPALIAGIMIGFRRPIRFILEKVPTFLDRTEKAKLGVVEFELRKQAEEASSKPDSGRGEVSPEQIRSAAKIEFAARELPLSDLTSQVERLCIEYEMARSVLSSGPKRTKVMNEIMAQMRTIGPSVSFLLEDFKSALSPGKRLAAIAMMQMEPSKVDLHWLAARFGSEAPFIFYQAALVLEALARSSSGAKLQEVVDVAKHGMQRVESFDGEPDRNTLQVLASIISGGSISKT